MDARTMTKAERKRLIAEHAKGCETCGGLGYVVYEPGLDPWAAECPTCKPYTTVIAPLEKQ